MAFTCSCAFYCFSLFSQILNIEMLQTSLLNILDVCFHSRWNIFYTRFSWFRLFFFHQLLSLHLCKCINPTFPQNTQPLILSFYLALVRTSVHGLTNLPCTLLSLYSFLHLQAWAITSYGDIFLVREERELINTPVGEVQRHSQHSEVCVLLLLLPACCLSYHRDHLFSA